MPFHDRLQLRVTDLALPDKRTGDLMVRHEELIAE